MDSNKILEFVREEDHVEYYLFPTLTTENEVEVETILRNLLEKCNNIIEIYTKQYLWHKDEFKLTIKTNINNSLNHIEDKDENLPPHLYGVTHYGDNIEDEWFIVFLLQLLTREINGLIARVSDIDGEFILIEAADHLPAWANPESCQNRVYLYEGNVHIIPQVTTEITVTQALAQINNNSSETVASQPVQDSLNSKLGDYPEKITENFHNATVYVPVGVAAILNHKPSLIAPVVQAFCNRDTVDLKACRAMRFFPPENRVKTGVRFTKCLYAMLRHSKYVPDRRTGWNLPEVSSPQYNAHSLGVKIACGFEILIAQAKPTLDIENDKGWIDYLKSLNDKGYFKGLLEHSKEHNHLLNKAKEYYSNFRDSMQYSPIIGQEILDLTKSVDYNAEELKKRESSVQPDDDDSWLNISPEELDKMLQEKYGQKNYANININSSPNELADKMTSFLNHQSDIEGVEFPTDLSKEKPKTKVTFSQGTKSEPEKSNKINFDPNSFSCAVQNILNFVIPEDDTWDLESDSEMSEYEDDNYVNHMEGNEEIKSKMKKYMEEMDRQLAATTMGESFEKKPGDNFEDIENFKPVDINVNTLKNILESYKSQLGEAGPSSTMLGPMGIHLNPENTE